MRKVIKTIWIDGKEYAMTPRQEVRIAINSGHSMDAMESAFRQGRISEKAFRRYERLWIWGTATEHPKTKGVLIKRWGDRRARIRQAVKNMPGNDVVSAQIKAKGVYQYDHAC